MPHSEGAGGGGGGCQLEGGQGQLTCRQVQDKIKLGNSQIFLQFIFGNLFYLLLLLLLDFSTAT